MGRSNETFGKKEVKAKKDKKRKEKELRRNERKAQGRDGNDLDQMIAYVDEFGNITATPPEQSSFTPINHEEIEVSVPKKQAPEFTGHIGIITFYNTTKGFGFIKDMDRKRDIFFHVNSLEEPVRENDKVQFEEANGPNGKVAVNVKIYHKE
jgi:cold shock CspA family protein